MIRRTPIDVLCRWTAWCGMAMVSLLAAGCGGAPATLAIGSPAPAFSLRGTDGELHSLGDYHQAAVLVVVFTCNHCPASQLYEQRIEALARDYRSRGVALVAINPDGPTTTTRADLAFSDVPETLAGMTERVAYRRLTYPYLYDGDGRTATTAFRVTATPQVFVFGPERTLQYVGRLDDNVDDGRVTKQYARAAIDALLARQPVRVSTTTADGCPVKRDGAPTPSAAARNAPITLAMAGPRELQALRANTTQRMALVNFWATWCGPCISEFPALQDVGRTYQNRGMDFITISIDTPDNRTGVLSMLQQQQAASRNYLFSTDDIPGLQQAFDPALPASVPFTLLLAANGDVLHQQHGELQFLELRRAILANLPNPKNYDGLQRYWAQ